MPSNLENFKAVVEAAFAGTTPEDDGSNLAYRFVDTLREERGNGNHRELCWRMATPNEIVAQTPEQIDWELTCELFLDRRNRTLREFQAAVEGEATELSLVFANLTALGTGVWEGEMVNFTITEREPDRQPRAGGVSKATIAVVAFNFRVLVGEV